MKSVGEPILVLEGGLGEASAADCARWWRNRRPGEPPTREIITARRQWNAHPECQARLNAVAAVASGGLGDLFAVDSLEDGDLADLGFSLPGLARQATRAVARVTAKREKRREVACAEARGQRDDLERTRALQRMSDRLGVQIGSSGAKWGLVLKRARIDAALEAVANRAVRRAKLAATALAMAKINRLQIVLANAVAGAAKRGLKDEAIVLAKEYRHVGRGLAMLKKVRATQVTVWSAATAQSKAQMAAAVRNAAAFEVKQAAGGGDMIRAARLRQKLAVAERSAARWSGMARAAECRAVKMGLGDLDDLDFVHKSLKNPIKAATAVATGGASLLVSKVVPDKVEDLAKDAYAAAKTFVKAIACKATDNPAVRKAISTYVAVQASSAVVASGVVSGGTTAVAAPAAGMAAKKGADLAIKKLREAGCSKGDAEKAVEEAAAPKALGPLGPLRPRSPAAATTLTPGGKSSLFKAAKKIAARVAADPSAGTRKAGKAGFSPVFLSPLLLLLL